jgi:WD40 repeat protein
VRIWDFSTGTEVRSIIGTGASGLVALSTDERWLLTAGGKSALLWDLARGKLVRTFGGHHAEVSAIAISPDDRYVVTADLSGRTRLWNRATGENIWNQRAHSAGINAAAFLPDGSRLLTASSDHTVGQFAVESGEDLIRETLKHESAVTLLVISPDGRRVVTNSGEGKVRIWNLSQRKVEHELSELSGLVSNLSLSADGTRLVTVIPLRVESDANHTGEQNSVVQFWDVASGRELPEIRRTARRVWSAAFAPIPNHILLVGGDRASLCEIGSERHSMVFSPHGAVTSAHFSPDETRIVTSGGDVSAKVWDVAQGTAIFKLALAHEGVINSAVYSPDSRYILTASDDRTVRLWDAGSGSLVRTIPEDRSLAHTDRVRSAAFSSDGKQIVTASNDRTVRVWTMDGRLLRTFQGHKAAVTCAAFSRDAKWIASGGEDNAALVWNAATGQMLGQLAGHTAAATAVSFSPDGLRILTGSKDSTAKLWDAQTLKEILTLKGHSEEVTSVGFSADGRYALTGSRDGSAIVWLADEWRTPD